MVYEVQLHISQDPVPCRSYSSLSTCNGLFCV